jgi:putative ABC transport system substrate-binding protein
MRRRVFIALLGAVAARWPVDANAQQVEPMRRIGVLTPFAADDAESMARIAAFLQGLGDLGWAVGRNVRIDYRWSAGDPDRIRKDAMELVALAPDVILATGTPVTSALQQASLSVPIVSRRYPIPWPMVLSRALLGRAATPPGLPPTTMQRARNGWRYSRRSRQASGARRFFAILLLLRGSVS